MGERIVAFCARLGFTTRIAVADSYGAAHALARHGDETVLLCPSGKATQEIAPLPLAALRVGADVPAPVRRPGHERDGYIMELPAAPPLTHFRPGLPTSSPQSTSP